MSTSFDYQGALNAGYTDDEIEPFLKEIHPNFDLNGAKQAGYSVKEINEFLSSYKPPDNRPVAQKAVEKIGRLATQGAIGGIQRATAPFDIPAIISRKIGIGTAPQELRQNIFQDIETLQEKKLAGDWDASDQERYDYLVDLIKNPEKMQEALPKEEDVPHFDVGSLIEKGAEKLGVDLSPQGADEMALRWIGFIKDPSKASNLLKNGLTPQNLKQVAKALLPSSKETLRGVGAAGALEYAAAAELGPMGTMFALVLGDMAPSLALKTGAGAARFASAPIETLKQTGKGLKKLAAEGTALLTRGNKRALQQQIINDFREAGIQANLGTISGNRLLQWYEGTLAQSGLTGQALEDLKKSLSQNIVNEYKKLTSELGQTLYESKYEAGEAMKAGLEEARELDKTFYRDSYKSASERAADARVPTVNVASKINEIERSLGPGAYKSGEQSKVIRILEDIKKDVMTAGGDVKDAEIRALINNKIALRDAINYEVQGGATKLLEGLIKEIDKAILKHEKIDPKFARDYLKANQKFAEHAKLFRGKTLDQAFRTQDPAAVFNKMNTPHGIDQVKKALSSTPEGRELFKKLAAYKMEELIGKNMIDSTTKQLNFGTFSKLLQKGQNREIVKKLIGEESLRRLEKLQNASGRLAETNQKFLNTSRSGVQATDVAAIGAILASVGAAIAGNPWPLIKTIGITAGAHLSSRLMADPEFLKLVEEAILASKKPYSEAFIKSGQNILRRAKELEEPAVGALVTQQ